MRSFQYWKRFMSHLQPQINLRLKLLYTIMRFETSKGLSSFYFLVFIMVCKRKHQSSFQWYDLIFDANIPFDKDLLVKDTTTCIPLQMNIFMCSIIKSLKIKFQNHRVLHLAIIVRHKNWFVFMTCTFS